MSVVRGKLIAIRKQQGKTQSQIAEAIGISRNYYSMLECGKRNPSFEVMKKISTYLEAKIDDLFFGF